MKRSKHARDILQRRTLSPALRDRPHGLAFKIDDYEIRSSVKNLPKMIIAVDYGCAFRSSAGSPEK